jgi:8-oxo-dGTP pyrophosphatase MutT (NUDIX family)
MSDLSGPVAEPPELPNPWSLLPPELLDRFVAMSREFAESGRPAVVPRGAATVVLLRPDRSVFLMRRSRGMAFGGMWAFPGGAIEADESPALAAVREVREETGVLLDPAALTPWHRWLTPAYEPRRFDTWFFLAALPAGQHAAQPEFEADQVRWLSPEQALAANRAGELPMLPPTLITLTELSRHDSVELMLAQVRDVTEPYTPDLAGFRPGDPAA